MVCDCRQLPPTQRRLAEAKREWMRAVWSGTAPTAPGRLSLARAVPRRAVSLQEFAWATCMVGWAGWVAGP